MGPGDRMAACSATTAELWVVAPYPALPGAMGHSPRTGTAYPTASRHTKTRNHCLITDEAYSVQTSHNLAAAPAHPDPAPAAPAALGRAARPTARMRRNTLPRGPAGRHRYLRQLQQQRDQGFTAGRLTRIMWSVPISPGSATPGRSSCSRPPARTGSACSVRRARLLGGLDVRSAERIIRERLAQPDPFGEAPHRVRGAAGGVPGGLDGFVEGAGQRGTSHEPFGTIAPIPYPHRRCRQGLSVRKQHASR